ncbi:MAG: hypothetical protein ACKOUM_07820 [Sphingopyxis sp.]
MNIPSLVVETGGMSPVALFMQADWVVKSVMLGLIGASLWTWMTIFGWVAPAPRGAGI